MEPENLIDYFRIKILAVEDSPVYQRELRQALGERYELHLFEDAEDADHWLQTHRNVPPDLVLLDVVLPGMDGISFLQQLRNDELTRNVPVIIMTEVSEIEKKRKAFELRVVDFITKPYNSEEVQLRIQAHAQAAVARQWLAVQNSLLEERVKKQVTEITQTRDAVIICMALLAEVRDNETGQHIQRTQYYVSTLVEEVVNHPTLAGELYGMDLELVAKSAPLHDVGKVGIPDAILRKPGPLTPEERKIIELHPGIGHEILLKAERISGATTLLRHARRIAFCHHEKWDGTGYPQGLAGKAIPIEARIMALADVFDALLSERVYKPALPPDEVLNIMVEGRGTHFDPDLTDIFLGLFPDFIEFARAHPTPAGGR